YAALAQGSFAYLAGQSLLSDPHCATQALQRAGRFVEQLLNDLQARGCRVVEAAGEEVLFVTPAGWDGTTEQQVIEAARAYLPAGVRLGFPGHYQALFARAPRNSVMLGYDGNVTLVRQLPPGQAGAFRRRLPQTSGAAGAHWRRGRTAASLPRDRASATHV